jgi:hypothetical protein
MQGCGVRREHDPGAYKNRSGAVPDRGRGLGHTAPTYILVGTQRDRRPHGSGGSACLLFRGPKARDVAMDVCRRRQLPIVACEACV